MERVVGPDHQILHHNVTVALEARPLGHRFSRRNHLLFVNHQRDIVLVCVRWYLAYPLSYRNIEDMMEERGIDVDHPILNRWVIKFTPHLETAFRRRKRPVGNSWRMDETYNKGSPHETEI